MQDEFKTLLQSWFQTNVTMIYRSQYGRTVKRNKMLVCWLYVLMKNDI